MMTLIIKSLSNEFNKRFIENSKFKVDTRNISEEPNKKNIIIIIMMVLNYWIKNYILYYLKKILMEYIENAILSTLRIIKMKYALKCLII